VQQQATATLLDEACKIFGVESDVLLPSITRMATKHALESERVAVQRDLLESEGRDEDALRREREGLDLDLLSGDIARGEVRQNQLLKDIAEASAIHHDSKNQLDALLKGRNAPALATERAEAGAELLSIAERWLVRAGASKLASRTIERHRALVQHLPPPASLQSRQRNSQPMGVNFGRRSPGLEGRYCRPNDTLRTSWEDALLRTELDGYTDYARHTRFRLVPGIW
jgi:hypothetical protein